MVVSCETAREINDVVIDDMLQSRNMETFKTSVATLTGGSGAVAVVVTDGSFNKDQRRRLLGGTTMAAPQYHALCRWGIETVLSAAKQFMSTDSVSVLKYGVELGLRTWDGFLHRVGWANDMVDKIICHQVGGPPSRSHPQDARHCARQGVFDLLLPRQHGHRVAAVDGGVGGRTRVSAAGRPRRLPRHRQRFELLDAGGRLVKPAAQNVCRDSTMPPSSTSAASASITSTRAPAIPS